MSQVPVLTEKLRFTSTFEPNNYKIMEVDEAVLEELLAGKMEIRGTEENEAIIVSDKNNYVMRKAEFTNTELLILPREGEPLNLRDISSSQKSEAGLQPVQLDFSSQLISQESATDEMLDFTIPNTLKIEGCIDAHYTLLPVPPRLNSLKEMLQSTTYFGEEEEYQIEEEALYTWNEIKTLVQASDYHMLQELEELHCVKIKGYYRIVAEQYWWECMDEILDVLLQNDIPLHQFNAEQIADSCVAFPRELVLHLLRYYSNSYENGLVDLNEEKLTVFRGVQTLTKHDRVSEEIFFNHWEDNCPYSIKPNRELLRGHAIFVPVSGMAGGGYWERYEENTLSTNVKERFTQLFEVKNEWTETELLPYLSGLIRAGHNKDKMLLRNTRILERTNKETKEKYKIFKPRHVRYGNKARRR